MGHPLSFKLFISKYTDLDSVTGHFSFLGTESAFLGWNDESFGKLWSYNLNYMDYLLSNRPFAGSISLSMK